MADALRDAMGWNWLDDDARPSDAADQCEAILAEYDALPQQPEGAAVAYMNKVKRVYRDPKFGSQIEEVITRSPERWFEAPYEAENYVTHFDGEPIPLYAGSPPASAVAEPVADWVSVPREATQAMCDAVRTAPPNMRDYWRAMLAAAPQPEQAAAVSESLRQIRLIAHNVIEGYTVPVNNALHFSLPEADSRCADLNDAYAAGRASMIPTVHWVSGPGDD